MRRRKSEMVSNKSFQHPLPISRAQKISIFVHTPSRQEHLSGRFKHQKMLKPKWPPPSMFLLVSPVECMIHLFMYQMCYINCFCSNRQLCKNVRKFRSQLPNWSIFQQLNFKDHRSLVVWCRETHDQEVVSSNPGSGYKMDNFGIKLYFCLN